MPEKRIIPPPFPLPTSPLPAAALPPLRLDAQGYLDDDIPCRKCAYNLRGLSPNGRCHECGTAVGRSLLGDFLRFSDPQWVQALASGAWILILSIILGIVVGIATEGLALGLGAPLILRDLLSFGVGVLALVGYWKLTTPDPGVDEAPNELNVRRLARISVSAEVVLEFVSLAVGSLAIGSFGGRLVTHLLVILGGIVAIVKLIAVFTYARRLAERIPDATMAKNCKVIMVASLVLCAVAFLGGVMGGVGGAGPAICVVGAVGLVLFIASIRLLLRFRKAFEEAARHARTTWASVTAWDAAPVQTVSPAGEAARP